MPARLPTLLLVAAALTTAAAAQTGLVSSATVAVRPAPSLSVYTGLYATDGGMVEVRAEADGLGLVAHGAPVAARLAPLASPRPALDARAEALLAGWVTGDLDALVAAVRPDRQAEAAARFADYRGALVRGHGPAVAASVVGTFRQTDGRDVTLAQILFAHGTEWASFVWTEDGDLLTLTRGLSPVVVGTVRPVAQDTFEGAGTTLWFAREADGRIGSLRVGSRLLAMR